MLSLPPWGRWRGAAPWRCTVTDEVRPPKAGVTAAVSTAATERVLGSPVSQSGFRERSRLPLFTRGAVAAIKD